MSRIIPNARYSILDTGYSIRDTGYWMLDSRYWMLDTGCSILDTGYSMLETKGTRHKVQGSGEVLKSDIPNLKSEIEKCSILDARWRVWQAGLKTEGTKNRHSTSFNSPFRIPNSEFVSLCHLSADLCRLSSVIRHLTPDT
jgi:hypothetical protein